LTAPKRTQTGEYPVYGSNGIVGTHYTYLIKEPAIIVGRKGSAGALNIATGPSWTTDVAYFVRPPSDLDLRFAYYLLSSLHLDVLGKGIKPGLSRKEAYEVLIALPPLAEQKRIVAKVDELMALCDRLEAQQQERAARHAALARAALARFADAPTPANLNLLFHPSFAIAPADIRKTILTLAVQGKLVPQDTNDEPVKSSFAGFKSLDTEAIDNVGVPSQWQLCTYRTLTSLVTSGSRGWKEFYSDSGAIFIRTQNIKTDRLVLDDVAFVLLPKSAEGMRAQVMKNDIMITITGANVTKAALVEEQIPEAYISQHIALTRPRWTEMSKWLHLCFLSHGSARGTLEQLAYGDKPGLNLNNIRDLVFPIPPRAEQRRVVAKVDQLMALVDQLETQLAASRAAAVNLMEAVVAELSVVERP
jgi:type I restriction enzyme S subunit